MFISVPVTIVSINTISLTALHNDRMICLISWVEREKYDRQKLCLSPKLPDRPFPCSTTGNYSTHHQHSNFLAVFAIPPIDDLCKKINPKALVSKLDRR